MSDFNIYLRHFGVVYDISDFVVGPNKVKIYERNLNWKPTIEQITINVVINIPYTLAKRDKIYIIIDSNYRFSGYITKINPDFDNDIIKININNDLGLLQEKIIDQDRVLYNQLVMSTNPEEYRAVDNEGYANYQWLYVLRQMFLLSGLMLNTSEVDNIDVARRRVHHTYQYYKAKEIAIDGVVLFLLNQNKACNFVTLEGNQEMIENRITYWDFVSITIGFFGLKIVPFGQGWFKLKYKGNLNVIGVEDNYKYSYSEEEREALYKSLTNDTRFATRSYYYAPTGTMYDLNIPSAIPSRPAKYVSGVSAKSGNYEWFNNLFFRLRIPDGTPGDLEPSSEFNCSYNAYQLNDDILIDINDINKQEITTDYKDCTNYNVVREEIDFEKHNSEIEVIV